MTAVSWIITLALLCAALGLTSTETNQRRATGQRSSIGTAAAICLALAIAAAVAAWRM